MTKDNVASAAGPAAPPRIDDLTCARALFAAWVFAYHLNLQLLAAAPFGPLSAVVARGYLGVDGFFVLSGIVMAHAHARLGLNAAELLNYWWHRFLRLYPIHISVIILLATAWAAGSVAGLVPRVPERFGLDELARHLLLIQGWGFSDRWAWNYPSWSISTEWAGYLAFPFLWTAARRLPDRALAPGLALLAGLLALVEWRGGGAHLNQTFAGALPRFFVEFASGILLARLPPGRLRHAGPVAPALLAVGLAWGWDTLAVAGLFLALAALYRRAQIGAPPLLASIPGLVFLGTISYAYYMSFAVVEMLLAVATRQLGWNPLAAPFAFALLATALTFALALLLWRWVERPAQRLRYPSGERGLETGPPRL